LEHARTFWLQYIFFIPERSLLPLSYERFQRGVHETSPEDDSTIENHASLSTIESGAAQQIFCLVASPFFQLV
jgi:hypothetical protein